ncbi:DUF2061 domain-containing protein [Alteromonas marina]|uniref:DUF2061 domain-containing protein n=1 Tax=Alteromonas sp. OM2203 TaxID=3398817 RepID=UPI003AF3EA77
MKKTITFAVMHFTVAFTVAYLLTGSVVVGGAVALVEPSINTVAFYFHEMVWKKLEARKEGSSFKGMKLGSLPDLPEGRV